MKVSIKNKVSWLIVLIVVLGFIYSVGYHFEWWPTHKVTLWNGDKGFRFHWHLWLNMHYLIGVLLVLANFVKKTRTDYNLLISFVLFDIFGWLSFNYCGWPEPVYLLITGFCISTVVLLILDKWKQ